MTELTQEQINLILKNKLNPKNYRVLYDSKTELTLVSKRGRRRTILK